MLIKDHCTALESKLVVYLDGRAAPDERHAVEKHLDECAHCRTRAEEFRAVWSVLDEMPVLSPSAAFDASLRARLAAQPVRRRFWEWLPAPRLAFATVALIALSLWMGSMRPTAVQTVAVDQPAAMSDTDISIIENLPVLENYDVVSRFDVLTELPNSQAPSQAGDATEIDR